MTEKKSDCGCGCAPVEISCEKSEQTCEKSEQVCEESAKDKKDVKCCDS